MIKARLALVLQSSRVKVPQTLWSPCLPLDGISGWDLVCPGVSCRDQAEKRLSAGAGRLALRALNLQGQKNSWDVGGSPVAHRWPTVPTAAEAEPGPSKSWSPGNGPSARHIKALPSVMKVWLMMMMKRKQREQTEGIWGLYKDEEEDACTNI